MKRLHVTLSAAALITICPLLTFAQNTDNLIEVKTIHSVGYESFQAFVLKNSIKKKSPVETQFSMLLMGVSTTEPFENHDMTPIAAEDREPDQDLTDGRLVLTVNMNCKTKTTHVEKVLSLDPTTGKAKEQVNNESDSKQDTETNAILYGIVCV